MGRVTDETGNRYGRLTVVRRDPENAYHKGANWICRCDCGGERVASGVGLRQGMVKSCGCLARERRVPRCACGYKGQKTRNWTPDWKCYRCSGASPLAEPPKMTEDELFEKRVEHWRYYHSSAPTSASHDVMLFLERLDKVTKERDMAIEQHRHSQHEVGRWVDRETKAVRELGEARERNTDLRKMLEQVTRDRDHIEESLVRLETQRDEAIKARDQYLRERDQARLAEERARESLDELDEAIYDCLPSDDDDDSPLDCVERAADRLRDLAQERDEARADLRELVRQVENAYELLKPLEDGSDVVERAVSHLLTVLRGRERPGPWAFDAVLRERDEARAEVERLRAESKIEQGFTNKYIKRLHDAEAKGRDAYRRGAEAMREACARWFREHDESFELTVDACHDVIADMPIPEEP